MGGKSKSVTTANTTTTTNTENIQDIDTTSIGLEDVEFGVVGGAGDLTINQVTTDQGAVTGAFGVVGRSVDSALDFADSVSENAIEGVRSANDRSLDFGDNALETSFAFGTNALAAVAESSAKTSETLGGAIERAAAATRSDSSQSLDKITKTGGMVLAAIAAVFGLYFVFKK